MGTAANVEEPNLPLMFPFDRTCCKRIGRRRSPRAERACYDGWEGASLRMTTLSVRGATILAGGRNREIRVA
jgi:hypothetical protein